MGVQIKNFSLRDGDYAQDMQQMYFYFTAITTLCTQWRLNYDNYHAQDASSAIGDNIITDNFFIDGDLLISVGYNDGFAIRKVLDDGTFDILYTDTSVAGGAGCTNLAINTTHHKAFASYYGRTTGTEGYDYTNFVDGGAGPIINLGIYTTAANNIPTNQAGLPIGNGFAIAGDYLYMMSYASTATMPRWNFQTDTDASLTVQNKSANGYRGHVFYHEPTDRIYADWYYNGELWVTVSASTAGAECYQVDLAPIYGSNDVRTFMSSTLNSNDNYIWQANYYGAFALIDITTAINGGSIVPTIIKKHPVMWNRYNRPFPYYMAGNDQLYSHEYFGSDLIIIHPYGNRRVNYGWYDQENCMPVGAPDYYQRNTETGAYLPQVEDGDNSQLKYAYGCQAKYIESSGQSIGYYTVSGYSGPLGGYKFRTWSADTSGFTFFDSGHTIFGDFTFDDSANIRAIKVDIPYEMIYILTDTNIECFVSNDDGSSWESYTYSGTSSDYIHVFSSVGNTAKVKLKFTGTPTKSAHISGLDSMAVSIQGEDAGAKWNTRTFSRIKIKGRG